MQPAHTQGGHEKRRISEILSHSIHRARYVLWTFLGLAMAFVIGYIIWTEVNKKVAADSVLAVESIEDAYGTWQSETNADKKAALEKDIIERVDALISKYPRQYGAERGLFIRADLSYTNKAWDKAAKDYQDLAERFPKSYLAPIALFNASICLEQLGQADAAQALYMKIVDSYKSSALTARALFDAARIDETKGVYEAAGAKYQQLGADFPSSTWTTLAKNRFTALRAEGKIQAADNSAGN
jgi:tetratricopeptide (TPR) repeat protein